MLSIMGFHSEFTGHHAMAICAIVEGLSPSAEQRATEQILGPSWV